MNLPDYMTHDYLLRQVFFAGMWLVFWTFVTFGGGVSGIFTLVKYRYNEFDEPLTAIAFVLSIFLVCLSVILFYMATAHFVMPEYYIQEIIKATLIHGLT